MNLSFKTILGMALLFITVQATAQKKEEKTEKKRYEHFKERTISKTYSASGNTLNINNSFGNVTVTTWDRNEIKVDIHIEASSTDKELADKMFENIDVTESKDGSEIKFKTTTSKNKNSNYNCKNCKSSMSINYTVQIPSNNTLKIENSFGAIKLPDYNGSVSLSSKFGSLTAGNLPKTEKLLVEFGKATLKNVNNATSTFKFSTVTIENLTCPHCGHGKTETMPTDACQWFYKCERCHELLKPLAGDCCVFCSYGTVPCPPIQAGNCNQCGDL